MYALRHKPSGALLSFIVLKYHLVFTTNPRLPVWVHREEYVAKLALAGYHAAGEYELNGTLPDFVLDDLKREDCEVVPLMTPLEAQRVEYVYQKLTE